MGLSNQMKYAVAIVLLVAAVLTQAGDRIVDVEHDDNEMSAAIAKAQASLDDFLAVLAKPPASATGFTVKIRIAHRNGAEHLWIEPFRRDMSGFVGIVANKPDHCRRTLESGKPTLALTRTASYCSL